MRQPAKQWVLLNVALPVVAFFFVPDGRYSCLFPSLVFLMPLGLLTLNTVLLFTGVERSLFKLALFSTSGLLAGDAVGYLRWGLSSGRLFYPDGETVWIQQAIITYYVSCVVVWFTAVLVINAVQRAWRHKRSVGT